MSTGWRPPRNSRKKLLLSVCSLIARGKSSVRPAVVVCELPRRLGIRSALVLSPSRAKLRVFGSRSMLYEVPKSSLGRNHAVMGGEMFIPACIARSRSSPVSVPSTRSRSLAETSPRGESVPYPRRSRTDVMSQRTEAALNGRNTRLLPLLQVRVLPFTGRAVSSGANAGFRKETRSSCPLV